MTEFYYKKAKLFFYILCLLLGLGVLCTFVSDFKEVNWEDLRVLIVLIFLLLIGVLGTLFYSRNLNTTVMLDDRGIYLQKNNVITIQTKWEEINKVDLLWLFEDYALVGSWALLFQKSSFIINICLANGETIDIGSELSNINQFISIVKNRVGDKFDTRTIPLKYKMVKN